jgi:hypothetical protein
MTSLRKLERDFAPADLSAVTGLLRPVSRTTAPDRLSARSASDSLSAATRMATDLGVFCRRH